MINFRLSFRFTSYLPFRRLRPGSLPDSRSDYGQAGERGLHDCYHTVNVP
jgi:hypothetical protein